MLRKEAAVDWDRPADKQLEAFNDLKTRLTKPPVLSLPIRDRPFMIYTDASTYQRGSTLLHQQDPDQPNEWLPIGL